MNWVQFKEILDSNTNLNISLKSSEDIDDAVKKLTSSIQSAAWRSCPTSTHPTPTYSIPLPTFARDLITLKRRARSIWQRTRLPSDKNIFNNLANRTKKMLAEIRKESFAKYTASLTVKNNSLWKSTKQILRKPSILPPLKKSRSNLGN